MNKNKQTLFDKLSSQVETRSAEENVKLKKNISVKIIILLVSTVICAFFFTFQFTNDTSSKSSYSIIPGYIWHSNTMKADFSFPIKKSESEYNKDLEKIHDNAYFVFKFNKNAESVLLNRLDAVLKQNTFSPDSGIYDLNVSTIYNKLNNDEKNRIAEEIKNKIFNNIKTLFAKGIVDIPSQEIEKNIIVAQSDKYVKSYLNKNDIIDSIKFVELMTSFINKNFYGFTEQIATQAKSKLFVPNLIYSEYYTEQLKSNLIKSVPKTKGIVRVGEVIIHNGEKINNDHVLKIQSYRNYQLNNEMEDKSILIFIGGMGHVLIIFSLILIYLFFIRKKIFYDNFLFGVICVLLVVISMITWISVDIQSEYKLEYLIIMPAFSMLAAIIFDSRTAFYITVTMSLLIAGIRGNDYSTGLMMMFTGSLAAFTVKDLQSRTQIFRSIFYIFIGFLLPIVFFGLERTESLMDILYKLGLSFINSAVSPIITFGLLLIIEKFTSITTDLKLEEYDNLNHPLLVKMNEIAPGTYQHSIGVSILAERCASAIGANELFVKVTSLYHDIGKMERPEYFAENQIGIENKHNHITPKKSADIIIDHVTRGVELANQYKLPNKIIDIIMMHHGDSIIRHFYANAIEKYGIENVNIEDYRYKGPKPNTKEAAIVMICDTSEAISRLDNKNKEELTHLVEKLINEKFEEGQFSECDITTHELRVIKDTIVKNLAGIYHKRIEYKEIPNENKA